MESKYNIADCLTRGKKPNEINMDSAWQNEPSFLELPESEWPILKTLTKDQLPELIKIASTITKYFNKNAKDTLASRINIDRYSDFGKFPGEDGRVRRVQVQYKNPKPGETVSEYHGRGFVTVQRAVNKLVVLIPKEEPEDKNKT